MTEFAILCVDDEEIILDSLKEQLRRYLKGDYRVELAENGVEALEVLAELEEEGIEVPIIISDQIMPGIKGDDLLAQVHELYPSSLKIFLTGQAGLDAVGNAVNKANLYRYISKPWDETDLHMTIREGLRRYNQDKQIQEQNEQLQHLYAQAQIDIKNLRIAETALTHARDELEDRVKERTAELESANASLRETVGDLNSFARTVAHDLKTPLSVMMGYADMLGEYGNSIESEQSMLMIQRIHTTSKKMVSIINELLLLASVRREEVQFHLLDMEDIVYRAYDRLSHLFAETGGSLEVVALPRNAGGYDSWVEEIWVNYMSNALKYGGIPPVLKISGEYFEDENQVAFWLDDNGPGLQEAELEQVFVEFNRLHENRAKGHGLGLSIVQRIVRKLGGRLIVDSEVGKGSRFGFTLPVFQEETTFNQE